MARNIWKNYLFWCANEHVAFKIPEMESILSMFKLPHTWIDKPAENPWMIIALPGEDCLTQIMSRSVMVKSCYELWAHSKTFENLHEQVKLLPSDITLPFFGPEKSFKIVVDIFNKVITAKEKLEKIESFSYLPIEGPVNLKNPDVSLHYFEFFGLDPGKSRPDKPFDYFFARRIGDSERNVLSKYSLKTRHFIGNTSMDPQLSMIMANMAQVENGHVVYDPFVGTGSLLVAAAHFGGYVCGSDIDYLTLHGKSKPTRAFQTKRESSENIRGNLEQYNLISRYLDVFVGDASRPVWRADIKLDSIITDPPYGIREPTEKVGSSRGIPIPEEMIPVHYPSKTKYGLDDIFRDLLNLAAHRLKLHGRLVFWIPIVRLEYDPSLLPEHPCLQLVANSEQHLTLYTSRRLITMEKVREPQDTDNAAVIHNLQFTFRHKFFLGNEKKPDRVEEEKQAKQLLKRSKKGNGVRLNDTQIVQPTSNDI